MDVDGGVFGRWSHQAISARQGEPTKNFPATCGGYASPLFRILLDYGHERDPQTPPPLVSIQFAVALPRHDPGLRRDELGRRENTGG